MDRSFMKKIVPFILILFLISGSGAFAAEPIDGSGSSADSSVEADTSVTAVSEEPEYDSAVHQFYANGSRISISYNDEDSSKISWNSADGTAHSAVVAFDTIVYAGGRSHEYVGGYIEMTGGSVDVIDLGGNGQRVGSSEFVMKGGTVGRLELGNSNVKKLDIKKGELNSVGASSETVMTDAEVLFFDNIVSVDQMRDAGFSEGQLREYVSVWLYLGENGILELPGSKGKWKYSQEWYYLGAVPEGETVKSYVTDTKGVAYYETLRNPKPYDGSGFSGWYADKNKDIEWDMDTRVISSAECHVEDVKLQDVEGETFKEKTLDLYAGWNVDYKRIYGKNRYSTSYKAAAEFISLKGKKQASAAIIADGSNYPDALSGSYLAGAADAPILLVDKKTEDDLVAQIYSDVKINGVIYILGGTGAVSKNLEKALSANYRVKRLAGADRYETNLKILKEGDRLLGDKKLPVMICTGTGFADSLSASATGNPVMLAGNKLTESQKEYISSLKDRDAYIIGGNSIVSNAVKKEYETLAGGSAERLYGKDRYDTSVKIAERFFETPSSAVLVCGTDFPDGLSGGPLAMRSSAPVLLAGTGDMTSIKNYLKKNDVEMEYVLGGPTLISDSFMRGLAGTVNLSGNMTAGERPDVGESDIYVDTVTKSKKKSIRKKAASIDERLKALDLEGINNVMIVAHPDDENFWGGAHLLEDDYLVVCITNGDNTVRKKEFMNAAEYSGDKGMILEYPDVKNGVKSKWQECQDDIYADLQTVLEYKDWDIIATHNPDGEYGHIHHKITDRLVTKICSEDGKEDRLFYFEKFFEKNEIPQNFKGNVSSSTLMKKHEMATLYTSQYKGYSNSLMQMEPYEFWIRADQWDECNKMMTRVYTDTEYK